LLGGRRPQDRHHEVAEFGAPPADLCNRRLGPRTGDTTATATGPKSAAGADPRTWSATANPAAAASAAGRRRPGTRTGALNRTVAGVGIAINEKCK
jgi:hypothetical protein